MQLTLESSSHVPETSQSPTSLKFTHLSGKKQFLGLGAFAAAAYSAWTTLPVGSHCHALTTSLLSCLPLLEGELSDGRGLCLFFIAASAVPSAVPGIGVDSLQKRGHCLSNGNK